MPRELIVIGASAGGVEALFRLAPRLPPDLAAPVVVVLHLAPSSKGNLHRLLAARGPLPAERVRDGIVPEPGRIYVAPPDRHAVVADGALRLERGPVENGHRPAIDALFRSAAYAHGPGVIGVILSGSLDDGAAGLAAIRREGGVAVVQDPDDAIYPSMPRSALEIAGADHVAPIFDLGPLLGRLAAETPPPVAPGEPREVGRVPSDFSCPACGGVLRESAAGGVRYACRVGHTYGSKSLVSAQRRHVDAALWSALRALEESGQLARRLERRSRDRGHAKTAERFAFRAREAEERAGQVREVLGISVQEERRVEESAPDERSRPPGEVGGTAQGP